MEEKAKLIKLNSKAWHYRLIRFMFRRIVPEPKQMQNLCPYFWLLISALILSPFVFPIWGFYRIIKWVVDGYIKWVEKSTEKLLNKWVSQLKPAEVLDIYDRDTLYDFSFENPQSRLVDVPRKISKFDRGEILRRWAEQENIEYNKIEEYLKKYKEEKEKLKVEKQKENWEKNLKRIERNNKKQARERKIIKKMDNFFSGIFKPFRVAKESFTFETTGQVIKATKRFVGLIITAVLLAATFFIVHGLTWVTLQLVHYWCWAGIMYWSMLIIVSIIFTILFIGSIYFIDEKVKDAKKLYKNNELKLWYAIPMYIGIGFVLTVKYVIWYPIYFIFVAFLWKFVVVSLIFGIFKGFFKGIVNFLGIFGEYFGAEYSSYCPGIEWEEEEK